VDKLVLAIWKECEDTFDLVGGRSSFEAKDAELQRQKQHRRGAARVALYQKLRVSHERAVGPFEIALAHTEIGLHEHEVGECQRIGDELPCCSRMTTRARDIPGSMSRPCGTRQSLSTRLVCHGEPGRDLECADGGSGRAARERTPRSRVELGSDRLVGRNRCRCTMPGLAIDVLVDFRQKRVGFAPRVLALPLVDDRADERVAERDDAVFVNREPIELRWLEILDIEVGLSERRGE
jgi:hypothetical protein